MRLTSQYLEMGQDTCSCHSVSIIAYRAEIRNSQKAEFPGKEAVSLVKCAENPIRNEKTAQCPVPFFMWVYAWSMHGGAIGKRRYLHFDLRAVPVVDLVRIVEGWHHPH